MVFSAFWKIGEYNGEINLKNLTRAINESCGIEQYTFTGNETVDDVCSPITRNTNCFNPNLDLLLDIDGAFCKRKFRNDIRSYRTELRDFLSSTTITTFTKKVMSHYETWNTSTNSTEIMVVIEVSRIYSNIWL